MKSFIRKKERLNTIYRLFLLGNDLKSKFFLLKYSIVFHLKKIGINLTWTQKDIIINIKFHGHIYKVYARDNINFLGVFREIFGEEQYKINLEKEKIKTIFDIGAHIGLCTIYYNRFYLDAQFYCVEPDVNNYKFLRNNILENKIKAIALNKAITGNNEKSEIKLYNSTSSTAFSTVKTIYTNSKYMIVQATTLEKIFKENNIYSIDILKCDIEGAEKEVFENIPVNILKSLKNIILEYHSRSIRFLILEKFNSQFTLLEEIKLDNGHGVLKLKNNMCIQD